MGEMTSTTNALQPGLAALLLISPMMEVTQFTSWCDVLVAFEKLAPLGQHGAEYQRRPPDSRWILDRRAPNV
jgi:hypothetical protein